MKSDKEKQPVFSLSINNYALIFLSIVAAFFIGIGVYAYISIEQARSDIHDSKLVAADEELIHAVSYLTDTVGIISSQISNWDEIFQQLENPSYYSYWREHRLLSADVIPDYIESAEVFDRHGNVLAKLSGSKFPAHIDVNYLSPMLDLKNGTNSLIVYYPIKRGVDGFIEGYLGLRLPFIDTLLSQYRFRFIDTDTLHIFSVKNHLIPLSDVETVLSFDFKPSPEAETMMGILKTTVLQLASIIGILCLMFYFLLVYLLGKPLLEISEYIDKLIYGNVAGLTGGVNAMFPVSELEKIKSSLNKYQADLEKANSDLDEKNQELWVLAHHDSLTGVLNRRAFELEWNNSKQLLMRRRVGVCLILFDVVHFKAINDTYGHQIGDDVLVEISSCIQSALRSSEKLYRIGGDEFAVIIIGDTSEGELVLAQRCIDFVQKSDFSVMGIKEKVRVSCGISHCQANELERLNRLQWQADVAVYQAKRPGVTEPIIFNDEMADGSESVFSSWINNAVFEAVTHGTGIEIHYQPIVDTRTRTVSYFEALVRIRHEGELIPPSHIFPIVTTQQMEVEMDCTIIAKVHEDMVNGFIPPNTGVSINLSAETVVHKDVIDWMLPLADFTQRYHLVIEVTETSLITQIGTASRSLAMLRKLGFNVALDDFGSGYSSLSYLTSMPVDIIKFDISLIKEMMDERRRKLVHEMASMLIDLDYELVAEGIETEELLEKVSAAGFKFSQGFLFGHPIRDQSLIQSISADGIKSS